MLTVALAVDLLLTRREADHHADWATAAPNDVVATAAGELAGTTTSASYGPPYNTAADGQKLGPLPAAEVGGRDASPSTPRTTWC